MAEVPWGDIAPGAAGGLSFAAIVWRGFRTLSRKLDHVERIPHLESEVGGLRTELRTHMAEEEAHLESERLERTTRQRENDARLRRIEQRVTQLAEQVR